MRLLSSARSPYVRKVLIVAHELQLMPRIERQDIVVATRDLEVNPANPNPFGQIPTLVTDEGVSVYDSLVICEYLASLAGAAWLFDGPSGRIDILIRHAAAQSMLDMLLKRLTERNRGRGVENDFCFAYRSKVGRGLDQLERNTGNWMQAPLDVAQIAAACAMSYVDFRFAADDWRTGRPALTEWFDRMSERPSMRATAFRA